MSPINVAVAVLFNKSQQVLITKRPLHAPHGGFWEFPGGKIETGEAPAKALVREIREEVGVEVLNQTFLGEIRHQYGAKAVALFVFAVNHYAGEARCCEAQLDLRWVSVSELNQYEFPEANQHIIALIKPCLIMKTLVTLRCTKATNSLKV
ncbi:MAG: 8-oxo-dGTP diphosphatase MutT [Tatlockia sp.]|jgi:8-oxo-dGTP diphosphatase